MKLIVITLSMAILVGCSHIQDNSSKRVPASVGVIGPDGEVTLYYRDADYIIFQSCDPKTFNTSNPDQARKNCHGKVNKIPVESFKQTIRNYVSTDRLHILKPLTPEEIQAFDNEDIPSPEQIQAAEEELDRINSFISKYGHKNDKLIRKDELVKSLRSSKTHASAIEKINAEIEKTLNLIMDPTKLTVAKYKRFYIFNADRDKFLYTILKNFDPFQKFPCGLKGSVDERIKDCSYQVTSENEGFVLVTRTKDFKEVHRETKTGLLWGDRLSLTMDYQNATKACKADLAEVARLSEFTWRLPSNMEYDEAYKNGIDNALPSMNYYIWASPSQAKYSRSACRWQNWHSVHRETCSVRCVAE